MVFSESTEEPPTTNSSEILNPGEGLWRQRHHTCPFGRAMNPTVTRFKERTVRNKKKIKRFKFCDSDR